MSVALLLLSTTPASGKTALLAGLGRQLQREGFSVAYLRLPADPVSEADRNFMVGQLGLQDASSVVSRSFADPIESTGEISSGVDVILIEGPLLAGSTGSGFDIEKLAEALDAKVVLLTRLSSSDIAGSLAATRRRFGRRFAGIIVNGVPSTRIARVESTLRPALHDNDVPLLGIVPYEPALGGATIGEIAAEIDGQLVTAEDMADELVTNLMIGSMSLEFAKAYFDRIPDKAVIAYTDKPEVQLAALESSTKCLISCGKGQPSPVILNRSEELGIPLILVRQDTITIAEHVGELFGRVRFRQVKKVPTMQRLVASSVDQPALHQILGLPATAVRG